MPTILQLRRGSTAENDAYTGSVGEITVDTTLSTVRLHDGSTAGGSLVGNLQKNIQLGITGDNEIDTSSGNLTIDSAGGTVTIDDNLNISGTTTVSGHILPDTDVTYDLGSSSFKFRDIYLSGTSINLGSATITASGSSIVLPSGSTISGGTGNLATENYVDTAVANVIDSAPGALDTLNELAEALGDDANYASTTTTALSNRLRIDTNAQGLTSAQKSNAITNLGLSTVATSGSYTDLSNTSSVVTLSGNQTLTNKILTSPVISTISNTGTLTLPTSTGTVALVSDIPTNNNQLTNGAGYLTSFTETNDLTASVTWANVPDANITLSSVTQHQAAFMITESQISDLGSYITASSSDILTNKTLDDATLTGTLTAGGGVGTSGQVLKSTGTGVEWTSLTDNDTNTTYTVSAVDSGDNAIIRLTGSDASTDDVTLAAGSNITITPSGDTITIASTAGSSYSDSNVNTHLNTSTASSGEVLSWNGSDYDWVAQSGGGSSLTIQDEGSTLTTDATTLNFTGSGVTASGAGSTKTINISGGASTIGALNDVTITSPVINQVLKYNGSAWVNAADATGSGSADLGAVAEDILPSFDEIYDLGSSTFKWYDGFFTNSINLDTIALTNSSGTLSINSDVSITGDVTLGSALIDTLLLSENTITADASTALQYLGDKGVVEINNSNLDVREGDWIGVPVVETVNSIPPLTTGAEGIIRYNKDESRFEGYNSAGWASLGGLEKDASGNNTVTGNLVVSGNLTVVDISASGDVTSTSDERLKENIKSIEGALYTVTKLSGKMFTMKSDETQKEKVGFIAQEVEQHLPQVVSTDDNGIKSISYGNVAALLVEAIKELNQKIEDLKK